MLLFVYVIRKENLILIFIPILLLLNGVMYLPFNINIMKVRLSFVFCDER